MLKILKSRILKSRAPVQSLAIAVAIPLGGAFAALISIILQGLNFENGLGFGLGVLAAFVAFLYLSGD